MNKPLATLQPILLDRHLASQMGITLPRGVRVYTLKLSYNPSRSWSEAWKSAGPNTDGCRHAENQKAGKHYPPSKTKTLETELVLVNAFYRSGSDEFEAAKKWASRNRLLPSDPRPVFAASEIYPDLYKVMGRKVEGETWMTLVATKVHDDSGGKEVCAVSWQDSERYVALFYTHNVAGEDTWFVFNR